MNRYILVAFVFMGFAYYELSGGSEFVPETREGVALAQADAARPLPGLTVAKTTRAPVPGLARVEDFVSPSVTQVSAPIVFETDDAPVAGIATASAADPAPAVEAAPPADLWTVTATRLNVRLGPSTNDPVVGQVTAGEEVAVLDEGIGDGWVMILVEGDGAQGWVASRFLSQ